MGEDLLTVQTGTGKTYTIMGDGIGHLIAQARDTLSSEPDLDSGTSTRINNVLMDLLRSDLRLGIVPRVCIDLFEKIESANQKVAETAKF